MRLKAFRQRNRTPNRKLIGISIGALLLSMAPPASAQLLTTPTPVTPSDQQVTAVDDATCVQQLDDLITGLNVAGVALDGLGLAAEGASQLVPPPGNQVAEGASLLLQVDAWAIFTSVYGLEQDMQDRGYPECDATFAGTVAVTAGGVNVTGNSIFQNGLGIVENLEVGSNAAIYGFLTADAGLEVSGLATFNDDVRMFGDLDVTGTITGGSVASQTGVSAYDGAIWIGQANNAGYDLGISVGGGAISGAGTGGAAAQALNINAVAIGNGAIATATGATSLGQLAFASGDNATAVGAGAVASGAGAYAGGYNAQATNLAAVAIGMNSTASGASSIAIGSGATATGSVAVGAGASASNGGAAFGDNASATGSMSTALGPGATASAANSVAIGSGSIASAPDTVSFGSPGAERRLMNVAEGLLMTDAVNLGQLEEAINRLERGVASSLAQSQPMLALDRGQTGMSVGMAAYRSETGYGLRFAHRFDTDADIMLSVGVGSAGSSDSTTSQAGLSFRF